MNAIGGRAIRLAALSLPARRHYPSLHPTSWCVLARARARARPAQKAYAVTVTFSVWAPLPWKPRVTEDEVGGFTSEHATKFFPSTTYWQ